MSPSFLWECFADIAEMKFYIQIPGKPIATEPAFFVYNKSLYLNSVGKIAGFRSRKTILSRIRELIENANYPLVLWRSKSPRKNEKPFAENNVLRVRPTNPEALVKAFNIREWEI